ncbi:MAG: DinB family protein [Bacteroidia bacterium]
MYEQQIFPLITQEVRRRLFEESVSRVKKCLNMLSEDQVWARPNDSLVSIGNLVLHCMGNARQWLGTGLGGLQDNRKRDDEFEQKGPIPTSHLIDMLEDLEEELEGVLQKLSPEDLVKPIRIQGFEENGMSILIHVIEHFSYHVGQISVHTKLLLNTDLGYYDSLDLNITGSK